MINQRKSSLRKVSGYLTAFSRMGVVIAAFATTSVEVMAAVLTMWVFVKVLYITTHTNIMSQQRVDSSRILTIVSALHCVDIRSKLSIISTIYTTMSIIECVIVVSLMSQLMHPATAIVIVVLLQAACTNIVRKLTTSRKLMLNERIKYLQKENK